MKKNIILAFNIVFWVVITFLMIIWLFDYIQVRSDNDPSFCLSKTTHKYSDGKVNECIGLGYKVYNYQRTSMQQGIEFVPFFVGMKTK